MPASFGLGLPTVKNLAELQKGEMEIKSIGLTQNMIF
jgi:hypothetical protein